MIEAAVDLAAELQLGLRSRQRELIEELVERVVLDSGLLRIELKRMHFRRMLCGESGEAAGPIVVQVPVEIAHRGVESRLVILATGGNSRQRDKSLIRAIACGNVWFEELASGRAQSFGEIADRVGVTDRYVSRLVDLAFVTPGLVEQILDGRQRPDVTVRALTVAASVPLWWTEQGLLI